MTIKSECANEAVRESKRPWEPVTVKVYQVRDSELGAGTFPDGSSFGSNPS
jgi:hypothetical protein